MVDCPHIDQVVCIDGVNLARLQVSNEHHDGSPDRSPHGFIERNSSEISEKVNWNCAVCETTESPWLCLTCGLVFCGRYVKGHFLSHSSESLLPRHCISMECNTYQLYCYTCDDYIGFDSTDRKLYDIQRTLYFLNKTRERSSSLGSLDAEGVDLGTEEEDENVFTQSHGERIVQLDEDSASVPEEDTPLFEQRLSEYRDGALIGGRNLRPRKRRISTLFESPADVPLYDLFEKRSSNSYDVKMRGLRNLGNTCFMNSVIQALGVTDVFREYLCRLPILEPDADVIEDSHHTPIRPRYNTRRAASVVSSQVGEEPRISSSFLAEEFRKVLLQLTDFTKTQPVSPDDFFQAVWKISPRFRGFQQQDAHEFLRCALDRLHAELRRCRIPERADAWLAAVCGGQMPPTASAISRIFEGSLQSQVVCLTCHTASNKHETFMDLSLDIFDRGGNANLADCIHRFFAKEELEQCEQYMCGHCMDKRPSTKQLMLRVLPSVICFHLKRFRWSHLSRGKLDTMVDFPLSGLDISPFMATSATSADHGGSLTFDLTSVVVHHGSGYSSGHYTTFGRRNGMWYQFNDSSVKECTDQLVLKQKAYLLFYTRASRI